MTNIYDILHNIYKISFYEGVIMELKSVWGILGIQETKNEGEIKQAYRAKLVHVNPEDNAEGFMQLRDAYEQAINFIRLPEAEVATNKVKNEVDLWIDKFEAIYKSIDSRINQECWEELLRDEICVGIDTNTEAREKLLVFLMDNYYLPNEIWKMLEKVFDIIASKEQLCERFPKSFIEYFINQINNEGFFDFELFRHKNDENADEYIEKYFKLKGIIDDNQLEDYQKLIDDLDGYESYHPYKDVEKIRYYLLTDKLSEAISLADELVAWYPDDIYILANYARVIGNQEQYDEAIELYQQILSVYPDYYYSMSGLLECLYKTKKYTEAKELALDILNQYRSDEVANHYLKEINQELIGQLQESLKDKQDNKTKLELAWCYYQIQKPEEAIVILEELPEEVRKEYDFINLYGRVYLSSERYSDALDKLKNWLDEILQTKKDDSIESKKKYKRLGYAYYAIGLCYTNIKAYEEAVPYYEKSIEVEEVLYDKLITMERLTYAYLKMKKFQECIDMSGRIIDISSDYYPAYIHRQEAYYELENSQEVINDYHKAIEIYAGHIKPYLLTIKIYIRHKQYEDAKAVVDQVKAAELTSNEFKLLSIKLARLTAETEQECILAIEECRQLKEILMSEDNDIEDPIQVDYEMALLNADTNKREKALEIMDTIIEQKPGEDHYLYIKGEILRDDEKYNESIAIFNDLLTKNPQNPRLYYAIGFCYLKQSDYDKALDFFLKTVDLNPSFLDVNDKIVDIYRELLNSTEKIEYYKKALPYANRQLEVCNSDYYYVSRGLLHLDAHELEKAISDFYKAREINPDNWMALNNSGYANIFLRNMDTAINDLKQATAQVSVSVSSLPYSNLAKGYRIAKEYDNAIKYYEMLHEQYPDSKIFVELMIRIFKSMGDTVNSVLWLDELQKAKDCNKLEVKSHLADIHFLKGSNVKANMCYMEALNVMDVSTHLKYAEFLLLTNNHTYAIVIMKDALKYAKKDDSFYIEVCQRTAELYWSIKLYVNKLPSITRNKYDKKANKFANMALEAINELYGSIEAYYEYPCCRTKRFANLASIYLSMGDEATAEKYIQMGLKYNLCANCVYMKCVDIYEIYGLLYEARDEYDKAIECYEMIAGQDLGVMVYLKRLSNVRSKRF